MTAGAPPRPHPAPPTPPSEPPQSLPGTTIVTPALAGLATIGAATSLTGVIQGLSWLGYIIVVTLLVGCTGLALRTVRTPAPLVGLAQLLVLLFLVTGVFTNSGMLAIIPGPEALAELNDVLVAAFDEIRTGLPPVEASPPILCLVTIAIGLVAVLVDTLAVAATAPAATGLILLCVYAVPSALAGDLLPWWTFALGTASFAALLAVDGAHRQRTWRNRTTPGIGASPGSASAPVAVVAAALVVGLVAGSTVTAIGTEGSLPGSSSGGDNAPGGLGVNPFTSLRGMLDQGSNVELFRVQGLGEDRRLMRAFTLDTYRPGQGWGLPDGPMPAGVPANGPLPAAPGDDGSGPSREIRIEPVNWFDLWLPTYGSPRGLRNLSEGWYYDNTSGTVFRERRQRPAPYIEVASLEEPSKDDLRVTDPKTEELPPVYTTADDVDPRVVDLAEQLTEGATNNFDRAEAIWRYFGAENGFVYDTETAPVTDPDALADFVLNGKRGFCEQYASSMAVMLRAIGIPSRVAIGFTTGYPTGEGRTITSQDAHAWVEVYFGDRGWVTFDPTPLSDGRGYVPPYLAPEDTPDAPSSSAQDDVPTSSSSEQSSQNPVPEDQAQGGGGPRDEPFYTAPSWSGWGSLVSAVLAVLLTAAVLVLGRRMTSGRHTSTGPPLPNWLAPLAGALWLLSLLLLAWQWHWSAALALLVLAGLGLTPSLLRKQRRRNRLRTIEDRQPTAASAAWDELLDECADRGIEIPKTDTVRLAAQKVAQRHHLDEQGKNDLRTVVGVVERSWYSPDAGENDPEFARAFQSLRASLRRTAPLSWRGRLLPRSLFRRRAES
ncbi:transglutaminase family protein [Prauserella cavernicola]|uniref:Transglutaminase domain-containing protein n=1 Tax=Prauserella cavernicola TaxID=2800127 RepID=A0A934QUR2_9PSEU|nr:DUF3488 and transglutaminase-like domain-containing protein [Prauserella cavernicola]MBK1788617.1 transglutaminase domain-containing protein [Prauserella cavernicola]